MTGDVEAGHIDATKNGDAGDHGLRPPRAAVGSHRIQEEMFGRVFDRRIIQRIWVFVRPYNVQMIIAVVAVLIFTGSQLVIPLIIQYAIDKGICFRCCGLRRSGLVRGAVRPCDPDQLWGQLCAGGRCRQGG